MGNFSNYWDLHTLFTKIKNKIKSVSDKIDDSVSLKSATGNPITLTDAANANAEELLMTIEPVQSGSGDPSPTNVRPISGLTEGKVVACGKNIAHIDSTKLFSTEKDPSDPITGIADGMLILSTAANGYIRGVNVASYTINNANSITVKMADIDGSGVYGVGIVVEIDDTKTYTLNLSKTGGDARVGWLNSDGSSLSYTDRLNIPITLTPPSGAKYAMILFCPGRNTEHTFSDIQLEVGTNATPYEPYTGATATITFGRTVYGGIVNFKTGEVTVTHGMVDLGMLTYNYTGELFYVMLDAIGAKKARETIEGLKTSIYVNGGMRGVGTLTDYMIASNSDRYFYIKDPRATTSAELAALLSGQTLCYELATPTTLTLTPAELELLKGNNTITANGGAEINIEYYPDNAIGVLAGRVDDLDNTTSDMQEQIDDIGTASTTKSKTAVLSTMGWYRFAKTVRTVSNVAAIGAAGIVTNFNIQRLFNNNDNETYSLSLALTTNKPIFKVMNASVKAQLITKVRYVIDSASSAVGYLEFYYGHTAANTVDVSLDRNLDFDLIDITRNTASSPVIVGECDLTSARYSASGTVLTDKSLETKYLHYISIQRYNESDNFPTYDVLIPIINNTAATMTKTEILAYLDEHGHIKPLHGMYIYRTNGNITSAEPVVDFVYYYYEGSEDKRLIFYRFEHDEHTLTTDAPNLRIEDRFVVQIVQNS